MTHAVGTIEPGDTRAAVPIESAPTGGPPADDQPAGGPPANATAERNGASSPPGRAEAGLPASARAGEDDGPAQRPGRAAQVLCGALQFLAFVAYSTLNLLVVVWGYEWISASTGVVEFAQRSFGVGAGVFVLTATLPILLKWLLIGRWRVQEIPVWGLSYVRFWVVKTAIRANPLAVVFAGSPLYAFYLRALGADIGRGVVILSRHVPICTDLLSIGDGTLVRKDAFLACYRAHDRMIQTGPVTLGRDVFVGEFAVLDIGTSMGDGAQLGHASSLHPGQAVPAGQSWHGSPAQPGPVSYRLDGSTRHASLRRAAYSLVQILFTVLAIPTFVFGVAHVLLTFPWLAPLWDAATAHVTSGMFYVDAAILSAVLFCGALVLAFVVVMIVPRVLNLALPPGRVFPLYGLRHWLHRVVERMTNLRVFTELTGDSSFIVHYLQALGYRLRPIQQTGSNFGMAVKQENPYLSTVGTRTMVADGLSILNADYSNTAFRLSRASIGAHSFLGNNIVYPAGGRTGDNVLLATKVMVPLDGAVRENVGLLGSPCFEIPRTVLRDTDLGLDSPQELHRRLRAKDAHNLVTMALFLAVRWFYTYAVIVVIGVGVDLYRTHGLWVLAAHNIALLGVTVGYWVLVDRCLFSLQLLAPRGCSIYDHTFWGHERYWKVSTPLYRMPFDGTPLKNVLWRLVGVRLGKGVFDDGCVIAEKAFVSIGDDCTLNAGSILQCHSQEDGAFKSDRTTIGAGCTIGVGAWVHYGVTVGDEVDIAADAFVMKGEEIPPGARWGGNPARDLTKDQSTWAPVPATTGESR